jgi:hypothetical protein
VFKKYNFIIGYTSSGKTQVLSKIAENLPEAGLFLDADSGFMVNNPSLTKMSVQGFDEVINLIKFSIKDGKHNIFLDGLNSLTIKKDSSQSKTFRQFFDALSKEHTYFFTQCLNKPYQGLVSGSEYFKNIKQSYSISLNLPLDEICVLETQKSKNTFEITNHELEESYNIGSLESLIRDYKIVQLLC